MITDNAKIFVVYHKNDRIFKNDLFEPIQVGAKLTTERFGIITDDTGDNISDLNRTYNELTAIYWIWKNTDYEYIGINHYRRFFYVGFNLKLEFRYLQKKLSSLYKKNVRFEPIVKTSKSEIVNKHLFKISSFLDKNLNKDTLIVPEIHYLRESLIQQYEKYHNLEHILVVDKIILKHFSYFHDIWSKTIHSNEITPYNMFIMHRDVLNDYAKLMFEIIEYAKPLIKTVDNSYQQRVWGFLPERIFTAYVNYLDEVHNKNIIRLPVLQYLPK